MSATESITLIVSLVVIMGGIFTVLRWAVGTALDSLSGEISSLRADISYGTDSLRAQVDLERSGTSRRARLTPRRDRRWRQFAASRSLASKPSRFARRWRAEMGR